MKKNLTMTLAVAAAAMLLGGCGSEDTSTLAEMNVEKYVTLGDYSTFETTATLEEVDEAEAAEWLTSLYAAYATEEIGTVNRAVQEGDTANIDYEGKRDDVAFDGGTAQGADLTIGSGTFIDGFEEGLIGVMPGETVDLNLTFPETYSNNPDLAGAEVVFTVTVNYVIPGNEEDMSDDVVAAMDLASEGVTTIDELKQYLYDMLLEDAQDTYQSELENEVLDQLISRCEFKELPEAMVENYRVILEKNLTTSASQYGLDVDTYTSYISGMTCAEFVDTYVEDAVRQDLALQAIANAEGLTVDDETLDAKLQEYVDMGGYSSIEEFLGDRDKEEFRNYFMNENVLEFLTKDL